MFTATRYAEGVTIAESDGEAGPYRITSSYTRRKSPPSAAMSSTATSVLPTPFRMRPP
jgi:hypothetical protein